jgi:hypothetical protein
LIDFIRILTFWLTGICGKGRTCDVWNEFTMMIKLPYSLM